MLFYAGHGVQVAEGVPPRMPGSLKVTPTVKDAPSYWSHCSFLQTSPNPMWVKRVDPHVNSSSTRATTSRGGAGI